MADELEGGVLDRELAQRVQRIADQIIANSCTARSLADLRGARLELFLDALDNSADSTPLTVALVALLLGRELHSEVKVLLRRYVHRALGAEPSNPLALLKSAYAAEPRGADLTTFLVALVLVEHERERSEDHQRR